MGVREDFFRLKAACIESSGAEQEKAEMEMDHFFASLRLEDEKELQLAVEEDFARIHREVEVTKELQKRIEVRKILSEVLPFISVSEFAKRYFGKSASWLHQRTNGNEVHGKVATFTEGELLILSNALQDVAVKLNNAATSFS